MYRNIILLLFLPLFMASMVMAQAPDKGMDTDTANQTDPKTKELSGMSIVGNDEAPKSLYIVPWKSSEIGVETSLNMMLDESNVPVDREVFKRKLEFYNVSRRN
jgi:hypothetical protein